MGTKGAKAAGCCAELSRSELGEYGGRPERERMCFMPSPSVIRFCEVDAEIRRASERRPLAERLMEWDTRRKDGVTRRLTTAPFLDSSGPAKPPMSFAPS